MSHPIIFFNNQWIEANQTLVHSLTPGIIRAKGVFETILIEKGELCFWKEHFRRFKMGLRLYNLKFPYSESKILKIINELMQLNNLRRGRLRLAYFQDESEIYSVVVGLPLQKKKPVRGNFKTVISPYVRKKNRFAHVKSIEYQPFRAALQEAHASGYDEAILLNASGYLVEGSTTNIFFVHKGALCTPSIKCGCLNGIIRQIVLKIARQEKIRTTIGCFTLNQLRRATEVFVTNSLIGIKPVHTIHKIYHAQKEHPVTERLQMAYRNFPRC